MSREAMQQALDALERSPWKNWRVDKSIDALRAALAQPEQDQFKPDWNTEGVLVEEMQRMAKQVEDLEAMLERQTARIVDLKTHITNLEGEE